MRRRRRRLAGAGVAVSIDTMRSGVAAQTVAAGAVLVNDVTGGLGDAAMLDVVAGSACPTSSCTGADRRR